MRQTQVLATTSKRSNRDEQLRRAHQEVWKKLDENFALGVSRRASMTAAIEELIDACEDFINADN
ncbi:MAG TPA: hypothetical protein VNC78_10540 [Actinomycetota bacterium]|nr:hypothetical protein [Actinomycetota bacterium]